MTPHARAPHSAPISTVWGGRDLICQVVCEPVPNSVDDVEAMCVFTRTVRLPRIQDELRFDSLVLEGAVKQVRLIRGGSEIRGPMKN